MKRPGIIVAVLAIVGAILWILFAREPAQEREREGTTPNKVAEGEPNNARSARKNEPRTSVYVAPAVVSRTDGTASLSGRVVSRADGTGIGGAELTFAQDEGSHFVVAAPDGAFTFTAPKPGTYQLASVNANGFVPFAPAWGDSPMTFTAIAGKKVEGVLIALDPERRLLAKVIDENNAPIARATLRVLVPGGEDMALIAHESEHTTDAAGRVELNAPEGAVVIAEHPGFRPTREKITEAIHKKGEMTIQLLRADEALAKLSIRGKTVDDRGAGVPDAVIGARRGEDDWWTAKSDAEGSFELEVDQPGTYALVASSPGLVSAHLDKVAAGAQDVRLVLHESGGYIRGRITAGSEPVASFAIVLSVPLGALEERTIGTRSFLDADGRYSLGPLEAGAYLVRAVAHGFSASEAQSSIVAAGKTSTADFRLSKGAVVLGLVKNASTAAPISGARIELEGGRFREDLPIEVEEIVTSKEDGSFTLGGVAPGLRAISAAAKGYDTKIISGLQVEDGATLGPIELRLTPLASPDAESKRELTGIGAALAAEKDVLLITQVIAGGGAAGAGLVPGDRIVAIDGEPVAQFDMNGAIQRIRGPIDTSVLLTVRRENGQESDVNVFRRKIRA